MVLLCADIANRYLKVYGQHGTLPQTLTELRTCVFFEQRRWRHLDAEPDPGDKAYIAALLGAIRVKVASGKRF
jgi:hypothetical protein